MSRPTAAASTPLEIQCFEAQRLRDAGEVLLVDCREAQELTIASIAGARWLPLSAWEERAEELAGLELRRVVVYCHHGVRSRWAAAWLRQRGFELAQSLAGGIDHWAAEVEPGMARY